MIPVAKWCAKTYYMDVHEKWTINMSPGLSYAGIRHHELPTLKSIGPHVSIGRVTRIETYGSLCLTPGTISDSPERPDETLSPKVKTLYFQLAVVGGVLSAKMWEWSGRGAHIVEIHVVFILGRIRDYLPLVSCIRLFLPYVCLTHAKNVKVSSNCAPGISFP